MSTAPVTLQEYIRACYPVILARTAEPRRFTKYIIEMCKENGGGEDNTKVKRDVMFWDMHQGIIAPNGKSIENAPPDERVTTNPLDALKKIQELCFATEKGTIYLLFNFHFVIKEPTVIQQIQNMMGVLKSKRTHLVIVGPGNSEFPPELDRDLIVYDYDLPTREEMQGVINRVRKWVPDVQVSEEKNEELLNNLQGLTEEEAESALSIAVVRNKIMGNGSEIDSKIVGELKGQMVRKSSTISIQQFKETFKTLIGFGNLKEWTLNRFKNWRPGLPRKGILILGGPGNGKSHFAKALGNELGLPVLQLNLDEIFGSLVGQSEAQLREGLKIIVAMAPCVVIVDEIEKALSGVGGGTSDGGTTQRVGGIFLRWLQDNEAPVFVVATCNDYSALPPEYTRMGRWDLITFVDNPTKEEAKLILDQYLKAFTGKGVDEYSPVDLCEYSGAEIRQVAIEAAYNGGDLEQAAKFVIPLSRSNKEKMDKLRQWASTRTVPASKQQEWDNKENEGIRALG